MRARRGGFFFGSARGRLHAMRAAARMRVTRRRCEGVCGTARRRARGVGGWRCGAVGGSWRARKTARTRVTSDGGVFVCMCVCMCVERGAAGPLLSTLSPLPRMSVDRWPAPRGIAPAGWARSAGARIGSRPHGLGRESLACCACVCGAPTPRLLPSHPKSPDVCGGPGYGRPFGRVRSRVGVCFLTGSVFLTNKQANKRVRNKTPTRDRTRPLHFTS